MRADGHADDRGRRLQVRGGERNKRTTGAARSPQIADELRCALCTGKATCDRTGRPHLTWVPEVKEGQIVNYRTGAEAEYPRGLCDAVGRGVRDFEATWRTATTGRAWSSVGRAKDRIVFSEIFAGPRAVLSARVARHLAVARASS